MTGKIRTKVLKVILSTSLGALLLLSITSMASIFNIRQVFLVHSDQLGRTAAQNSQTALEIQVKQQLISLAQDRAALTDEKLSARGMASEDVNQIINSTKIGETGYAFLLNNENGEVIMSPKITDIRIDGNGAIRGEDYLHSNNPSLRELTQRMINQEDGFMELEIDGAAVYVAYHPLTSVNWSLGVVAPIEEIIAPARFIEQNIIQLTKIKVAQIDRTILVICLIMGIVILLAVGLIVFLALRLSNSLTAPIISLSHGALIVGAGDLHHRFEVKTGDELETLSKTFNQMIGNIQCITAEKERIGAELNVATKIQASMLPCIFPPFPELKEFDIYAEMHPAKEVGGDFYDFFLVDQNKLVVVIADVSGKGVPAALFMVIAKTLIKNHAQMDKPLNEVFAAVNNQLCENNDANMFVTAFIGLLEINTGRFSYVNAGHNPPVIKHGDQGFTWLTTKPGIILGTMEDMRFKMMETTLAEEDMLFLYTDGVNEAMNPQDKLFGSERILAVLNAGQGKDNHIQDYIKDMLHEIEVFADGAEQADDITMLMLHRKRFTP